MQKQKTPIQELKEMVQAQSDLIKKMSYKLKDIHQALDQLINPNYRRPLADFAGFDWQSIGAIIIKQDQDGPAEIQCGHFRYTRRSGSGKFGKAIWFSRCIGQNEQGKLYARLITFKDINEAEELDGKVSQILPEPTKPTPQKTVSQKPARQQQAVPMQPKQPVAQVPVIGPTTPAQPAQNPRLAFSRLGSQAIKDNMITPDKYNQLAKIARSSGDYGAALNELKQCLA